MKSKGTVLAAATALLTVASLTAASAQTSGQNHTRMNAGQNNIGASGQMNAQPGRSSAGEVQGNFRKGATYNQSGFQNANGGKYGKYGMTGKSGQYGQGQYRKSARRDFDDRRVGDDRRLGRDFDRDHRRVGYLEGRRDRDIDRRVGYSGRYHERSNGYAYGGWNGGYAGYAGYSGYGGDWGWGGGPGIDVSVGYGGWGWPGYYGSGYGYGYPGGLYSYSPGYVGVGFGGSGGCTCGGGPGWWR